MYMYMYFVIIMILNVDVFESSGHGISIWLSQSSMLLLITIIIYYNLILLLYFLSPGCLLVVTCTYIMWYVFYRSDVCPPALPGHDGAFSLWLQPDHPILCTAGQQPILRSRAPIPSQRG